MANPGRPVDHSMFSRAPTGQQPATGGQFVNPFPRQSDGSLPPVSGTGRPRWQPYAVGRRGSVSSESYTPKEGVTPVLPFFPKTEEQLARLKASTAANFLFRGLDPEQEKAIFGAFREHHVKEGDEVIKQNDVGDYFYVVETGLLDIYVSSSGMTVDGRVEAMPPPIEGEERTKWGVLVERCRQGSSFGELALMYNARRAATVIAKEDCMLWMLDRLSFRTILLESGFRKRKMYENVISMVPAFKVLTLYERCKIADALDTVVYKSGDTVIREGDEGDRFYIIESGWADVKKLSRDGGGNIVGPEVFETRLKAGDCFGEVALLYNTPRTASVYAGMAPADVEGGPPQPCELRLAYMKRDAFQRLMGPAAELLKRRAPAPVRE